jgi:hypothetical protein
MAGFPHTNEGMRIYRDKDRRTYFLVIEPQETFNGNWDALANVYDGPGPSLVGTMISRQYVSRHRLKRMQWDELPREWQAAFRAYMAPHFDDDPPFEPEKIRGFWRVGSQPLSGDNGHPSTAKAKNRKNP